MSEIYFKVVSLIKGNVSIATVSVQPSFLLGLQHVLFQRHSSASQHMQCAYVYIHMKCLS